MRLSDGCVILMRSCLGPSPSASARWSAAALTHRAPAPDGVGALRAVTDGMGEGPARDGGLRSGPVRAVSELDLEGQLVLTALDGERDLVAGLLPVDTAGQLLHRRDRPPVHRDDDVAALQPRVGSRGVVADVDHDGALLDREAVQLGDLPIDALALDAEERVLDLAAVDELVGDGGRGLDRDGEPDPGAVATAGEDGGVDADDLATGVDQRPAGVARVDRRVGLDHVDLRSLLGAEGAVERADDAGGHRTIEAEGRSDGDGGLTDPERVLGVGRDREVVAGYLHDRDVRHPVRAEYLPAHPLTVGERDHHLGAVTDDMRVGDDVTLGGVDDAGPGSLPRGRGHVDPDDGGA